MHAKLIYLLLALLTISSNGDAAVAQIAQETVSMKMENPGPDTVTLYLRVSANRRWQPFSKYVIPPGRTFTITGITRTNYDVVLRYQTPRGEIIDYGHTDFPLGRAIGWTAPGERLVTLPETGRYRKRRIYVNGRPRYKWFASKLRACPAYFICTLNDEGNPSCELQSSMDLASSCRPDPALYPDRRLPPPPS